MKAVRNLVDSLFLAIWFRTSDKDYIHGPFRRHSGLFTVESGLPSFTALYKISFIYLSMRRSRNIRIALNPTSVKRSFLPESATSRLYHRRCRRPHLCCQRVLPCIWHRPHRTDRLRVLTRRRRRRRLRNRRFIAGTRAPRPEPWRKRV